MKKSSPRRKRRPVIEFKIICGGECVVATALDELAKVFQFRRPPPTSSAGAMAALLVVVALAHIDVIAPRMSAMIRYCDAEGLDDQHAYLESLIKAKFAKKLHRPNKTRA